MENLSMLQWLLPLIVFAVVDIFASVQVAIIAAMLFAVAEAAWSYSAYGEIDQLTWVSLFLVVAMGAVAYKMKNEMLFKFQPVVLAAIFAGTLGYFQIVGHPLMVQMIPKILPLLPAEKQAQLADPRMLMLIKRIDLMMVFGFIAHGALVAWAAVRGSTWTWLMARGIGIYAIIGAIVLINGMLGLP